MRSRAAGLSQAGDGPPAQSKPLGAGVGAVVVVVATVRCVLHQACSRLHRVLSRQQPCELDVKIPIV